MAENEKLISLAVWIQYKSVTAGRTDWHRPTASTVHTHIVARKKTHERFWKMRGVAVYRFQNGVLCIPAFPTFTGVNEILWNFVNAC